VAPADAVSMISRMRILDLRCIDMHDSTRIYQAWAFNNF
jgi:hypothetical protein